MPLILDGTTGFNLPLGAEIGVGTNAPGGNGLHVDHTAGATLRLTRLGTSTSHFVQLETDGAHGTLRSEGNLTLQSGGANPRITISSTGYVGINFTDPASTGSKLVVEGIAGSNAVFVKGNAGSGVSWGMGINAGSTSADASFRVYDKDGSASYLFVRGDGNVGIGTDSPDSLFELEGSSGARMRFTDTGTQSYTLGNSGTSLSINNESQSTTPFSIDSSGNLLIGTTTEGVAGGENLTIGDSGEGGMTIRTGTSSKGNIYFSDGTSGDSEYEGIIRYDHNGDYMTFATASAHRMRIDSSGNVGIGTTSPDSKLHVFNGEANITADADADDLIVENNGAAGITIGSSASSVGSIRFADSSQSRSGMVYYSHITNEMRFYTNQAQAMTISSTGNVGIGTASPDQALQVKGIIETQASNSTNGWMMYTYTDNTLRFNYNGSGGDEIIMNNSGQAGIGTAPYTNARLTLGGTDTGGYPAVLQFDNNNSSGAEFFMLATDTNWSAGSNKFIMGHGVPSSSNVDMTIDSTGYVGINTSSPQRALHIHDHSATGLHITNTQSGAGSNDGFSMYIRDDNQATELMGRENSYLGFGTNNTLRAKILSSGEMFWPEIGNRGDLTFPICSISNSNAGGQYLHAQFQSYGGAMVHIHFRGYEYIGNSIREGSGGGYVYNTSGQQVIYSQAYSGHCVQVYQTTTNRVELVINTGSGQTSNRWGSYVFFGGTDTITGDTPLTLVQYGWSSSTGRLYSS